MNYPTGYGLNLTKDNDKLLELDWGSFASVKSENIIMIGDVYLSDIKWVLDV